MKKCLLVIIINIFFSLIINKCRAVWCQTTSSSWLMTRFGTSRCYCRTSWGDCFVLLFVNYCGKREGRGGGACGRRACGMKQKKKNRGKRYYIGAPPIKLYNNNISCPVELLYLRHSCYIYWRCSSRTSSLFFSCLVSAEGSVDFPSVVIYSCCCVLSAPFSPPPSPIEK